MIPTNTPNTPDALRLAAWHDAMAAEPKRNQAKREKHEATAVSLRRLHAEVERLNSCLQWEQNRANRMGTHGEDCWKWGPAHYECALREVEKLRQADHDILMNVSGLRGLSAHVRAVDAYKNLVGDMDLVDKAAHRLEKLAGVAPTQAEPVLTVEVEPDYFSGGHHHEGTKPYIKPTEIWKLPIGTRLYTHPPIQADACKVPMDQVLVPVDFLRGFNALAHNYSLRAEPPDYYRGVEGDAFSMAYRRCGHDLAKLRAMLSASQAAPTQTFMGFNVVHDKSLPPDAMKFMAAPPQVETHGFCCYGGQRSRQDCASCAKWIPAPLLPASPSTPSQEPK